MSYEIGTARLAAQIEKELEAVEDFQHNINQHIRSLDSDFGSIDATAVVESIRFNKQMQKLYLERAAAKLELVALFNEDSGDCTDLATIQNKLNMVRMVTELPNQAEVEPVFKGMTLEAVMRDAEADGFCYIRSSLTGITQTIDDFLSTLDSTDENPLRRYGLFHKTIVCLNDLGDRNAEVFALD